MFASENLKKIISVIVILFFHSTLSFSQENYVEGYVLNLDKDTLRGFIDYREWKRNPKIISFRKEISAQEVKYTPMDISGFGVAEELYVSAIVDINISPARTDDLTFDRTPEISKDTTFLQAMILGSKSLYFLIDEFSRKHFYLGKSSGFELLIYKKYFKKQNDKNVLMENNQYKGQLNLYLNDCPKLQSSINQVKFHRKYLEKLFIEYYSCSDSDISFHKEKTANQLEFGIMAGITTTSLNFESKGFEYLARADFESSLDFSGGLSFELIFGRSQRKISLYNELIYTNYSVSGSYEDFVSENQYSIYTSELSYSYIKLHNLFRYTYPPDKRLFYFNIGISNGLAISNINRRKKESTFFSTQTVDDTEALEFTTNHEYGYVVGAGYKYDPLRFEIKYESGNGMSRYINLRSKTHRLYFLVGYKLSK